MSQIEEPRQGGSYVRQPDGSLVRVAFTEPPKPRDKRPAGETNETTPAEASVVPGVATSATPGGADAGPQE